MQSAPAWGPPAAYSIRASSSRAASPAWGRDGPHYLGP